MLRTALGPAVGKLLDEPEVVEVMLNPDGRVWVDRLGAGLADTGLRLSPADGERIIRLVASHLGAEVHGERPRVSAELPETGERFEGLLPPVVTAPVFAIRKPAVAVFSLDDYVGQGIMTAAGRRTAPGGRRAPQSPDRRCDLDGQDDPCVPPSKRSHRRASGGSDRGHRSSLQYQCVAADRDR
jgi:hypothetical protein